MRRAARISSCCSSAGRRRRVRRSSITHSTCCSWTAVRCATNRSKRGARRWIGLLARAPAPLRLSTVFTVPPEQLLREAGRLGLEGIVAKAAGSHYEPGRRSGAWLKCRISSEQEICHRWLHAAGGAAGRISARCS
ncbi:MAG: hypothetical protein WDM96_17895 [Lacunisphaera sp.]